MKLPSLFKTPKYRKFDYNPRYYDPVKEEVEERVQRIKREMGEGEADSERPRKSAIRFRRDTQSKTTKQSNHRLIIIIIVLSIVAYLLLK